MRPWRNSRVIEELIQGLKILSHYDPAVEATVGEILVIPTTEVDEDHSVKLVMLGWTDDHAGDWSFLV